MSVQKLVAEADKLFEKGKMPEGIAKLKAAFSLEPLNQLVATKLAGIYVQNRDPLEAAKIFGGLAKRLSDAGKSSVAIAIYKQALELAPDDISLRFRYAVECEAVGKLGDAFLQGQIVLNYYLRRKKYFDASNVLPVIARAQPKDDKVKAAWIEVMQLCQADQKLVNLLVALCGPPGVVAADFPVGGDPITLTPALYESLKKLVPFFPRDAKIAYAVAWCAYRRGRRADMYHFLQECLRREPDFCLAILLFSRVLSEDKKLNEALFTYRYYKERMASDKSTDMLTLNRLLESYVEKNGWIKFTEEAGDLLDAVGFLRALTGLEKPVETESANGDSDDNGNQNHHHEASGRDGGSNLPPAEIELGLSGSGDGEALVILTATGQSIQEASAQQKAAPTNLSEPMRMQAELIKATVEAAVAGMGSNQQQVVQPVVLQAIHASTLQGIAEMSTQATIVHPLASEAPAPVAPAPSVAALAPAVVSAFVSAVVSPVKAKEPEVESEEETTGSLEGFKGESVEFTSLIKLKPGDLDEVPEEVAAPVQAKPAVPKSEALTAESATRVEVLSPITNGENTMVAHAADSTMVQPLNGAELGAAPTAAAPEEEEADEEDEEVVAPKKKKLFNPLEAANLPGMEGESSSLALEEREERTAMFSPMDLLDAVKVMQNRDLGNVDTKKTVIKSPAPDAKAVPGEDSLSLDEIAHESDKTKWKGLKVTGERTVAFTPVEAVQAGVDSRRPHDSTVPPPPVPKVAPAAQETDADMSGGGDATVVLKRPDPSGLIPESDTISLAAHTKTPVVAIDPSTMEAEASGADDGPAFMPIPAAAVGDKPGAGEDKIDLGDDLLEGPTRILTPQGQSDKTEHLLKEIKQDFKHVAGDRLNVEMLMKKAERFTAKRNYYLARKALRHAQALGADEIVVKERLREIRKLEFPEGLYNTMSSDQSAAKVDTGEVLDRLELEFDLTEGAGDSAELSAVVELRIDAILEENDPRTILDFGVGLHEMGLFKQAEALFIRVVEEYPDYAFDAYYLAATSKLSRRDYAGAASILKRLSSDNSKTDLEKIQIYYALGETFEKMRQTDRSKKFFKKVAELDSNYRNIRQKKLDG